MAPARQRLFRSLPPRAAALMSTRIRSRSLFQVADCVSDAIVSGGLSAYEFLFVTTSRAPMPGGVPGDAMVGFFGRNLDPFRLVSSTAPGRRREPGPEHPTER